jgi:hypothetical protein
VAPRRPPQRRGSQSPNTVLVIFLIFFVLGTIIAGVLAYYGYDGQKKLKEDAAKAETKYKAAAKAEEFALFQSYIARKALGAALVKNDKSDEETQWQAALEELTPDGTIGGAKFKDEQTKAAVEEMFKKAKDDLGWDPAGKKFVTTYRAKYDSLSKAAAKAQGDYQTALNQKDALKDELEKMAAKRKIFYEDLAEKIKDAGEKSLAASEENAKKIEKYLGDNTALTTQLQQTKEKYEQDLRAKDKRIFELQTLVTAAKKEQVAADGGAAATDGPPAAKAAPAAVHALLLDVSQGKPLWDRPVARVTDVDASARKVYLDKGSAAGIRPQMTFTVFAAGPYGRAGGPLKGTVEVQEVLDANTSVAWVTSLYDASGAEVPLHDDRKNTTSSRQNNDPIRKGDLLFNLALGAHVAIAGAPGQTGAYNLSAGDQLRELQQFVGRLRKQGVTVDAYLDLTDGEIKGAVTPRTNYLIRGELPRAEGDADAPAAKVAKAVAASAQKMRDAAVARGAFIISVDNFLAMMGYRHPHSAAEVGMPGFRPSGIGAGTGQIGQALQGAAPKEKAMDKEKEKEKEK